MDAPGAGTIPVTLIPGDGIGPECVEAARRIVEAAGAPIDWEVQRGGRGRVPEGRAVRRAARNDGVDRRAPASR